MKVSATNEYWKFWNRTTQAADGIYSELGELLAVFFFFFFK